MEGICRLCQQRANIQSSHVLPSFVFKWLKKDGFIRHGPTINRRVQDGAKEEWLCLSCEGLLNGWETQFANKLFHPMNEEGLPTIAYGDWLLKFCTSVSWRSLLYLREQKHLTLFSDRQIEKADRALETWRQFLLGEQPHPNSFEQHLLPFGPIKSKSAINWPPNINRYLLRTVEINAGCSDSIAFIFSKLGKFAVLGFISLEHPEQWSGSKIRLRGGSIKPRQYIFPIQLGHYLSDRATRAWNAMERMSDVQNEKVNATIRSDIDKFARSELRTAIEYDVALFGKDAFHKRRRTDGKAD